MWCFIWQITVLDGQLYGKNKAGGTNGAASPRGI